MQEQNPIVLMNFSGIYREEEFWKTDRYPGLSFRMSVGQTAIVMRKQSQRLINEQKIYPTAGIHFIDSGNYHYMTRLWLTRMDQPFCLLVYDNHTDMHLRLWWDLSCGGWIAAALEDLENLKYVILVGPDESSL